MTDPLRIGVLGVGNVLMGDDRIGPFLIKVLEARYEFQWIHWVNARHHQFEQAAAAFNC